MSEEREQPIIHNGQEVRNPQIKIEGGELVEPYKPWGSFQDKQIGGIGGDLPLVKGDKNG